MGATPVKKGPRCAIGLCCLVALVCCGGPPQRGASTWAAAPPAEQPPRPPDSPDSFAPGFDVMAFASADGPRVILFSEDGVLWVDEKDRALMGPDEQHLKPTGLIVPRSVVAFDQRAVFWLTSSGSLYRGDVGGGTTLLWSTSWEVDSVAEDVQAFWIEIVDCRKCTLKGTARWEIWRVPKRGGEPALFASVKGALITEFTGTVDALYLVILRGTTWTPLRVPVVRGLPGAAREVASVPDFVDADYYYEVRKHALTRTSRRGGPITQVARVPESPVRMDENSALFTLGDELYALPKTGGRLRLLADWSDDDLRNDCWTCGSTADAVCLRCSSAYYRVPKRPRPLGRRLVYQGGGGVAVGDDALFWFGVEGVVRRDLNEGCGVYSDECNHTLAPIDARGEVVSSLIRDAGYLYYVLADGSLWRVAEQGGAAEELVGGADRGSKPFEVPPFQRYLAPHNDHIYFVDVAGGRLLRWARTGDKAELVRDVRDPRGLVVGGGSLYLVEAESPTRYRWNERSVLLELDPKTLEPRATTPLPGGFIDVAATDSAAYVSVGAGTLLRIPRGGGVAQPVFPSFRYKTEYTDETFGCIDAGLLAGRGDTLYFTTPGRVNELVEGSPVPRVLTSRIHGKPESLVPYGSFIYFSHGQQHKWEHWIEIGRVPVPEREAKR